MEDISEHLRVFDECKLQKRKHQFELWNTCVFKPLQERIRIESRANYRIHRKRSNSTVKHGRASRKLTGKHYSLSDFGCVPCRGDPIGRIFSQSTKSAVDPRYWRKSSFLSTLEGGIARLTNTLEGPSRRLKFAVEADGPKPAGFNRLTRLCRCDPNQSINITGAPHQNHFIIEKENPEFPTGKRVFSLPVYLRRNPLLLAYYSLERPFNSHFLE